MVAKIAALNAETASMTVKPKVCQLGRPNVKACVATVIAPDSTAVGSAIPCMIAYHEFTWGGGSFEYVGCGRQYRTLLNVLHTDDGTVTESAPLSIIISLRH